MATSSADVPEICDLVINGERYMYSTDEQNKAAFTYAQPFVPRTNTENDFGDDKQDFWMIWGQNDWSGGEGQKYQARSAEDAGRFWRGKNVNINTPGELVLSTEKSDLTFAANPKTAAGGGTKSYFATSTNLYSVNTAGSITDHGAHGLGASPSRFGMCVVGDPALGGDLFLTTHSSGTVGVRRWNGTTFATYSATDSETLAFVNNALYGYSRITGSFQRYTPGAVPVGVTDIYTWRDAEAAFMGSTVKLIPMGGKIIILKQRGNSQKTVAELWIYDGQAAPVLVAELPPNFFAYEIEASAGTIFISGSYDIGSTPNYVPVILFYKDGAIGELWKGEQATSDSLRHPPIVAWEQGIVFVDYVGYPGTNADRLVYYNAERGSFSTLIELDGLLVGGGVVAAANSHILIVPNTSTGTAGYVWGISVNPNSTGEADTSIIDFNSSLKKIPRGVTVIFDEDPTENNSSIDIKYAVNGETNFTTLQTDAASGTEYTITPPAEGTTYHSFQIRTVLNKGGGGALIGPKLKRIKLRAMPVASAINSFSSRVYRIQLLGKDGEGHVLFHNGELNPKDGKQMHADLRTATTKTAPISVTDTMGTYVGIIEKLNVIAVRKDEFVAEVSFKEV